MKLKENQEILMPEEVERVGILRNIKYRYLKTGMWVDGHAILVRHAYKDHENWIAAYCFREGDKNAYISSQIMCIDENKDVYMIDANNMRIDEEGRITIPRIKVEALS